MQNDYPSCLAYSLLIAPSAVCVPYNFFFSPHIIATSPGHPPTATIVAASFLLWGFFQQAIDFSAIRPILQHTGILKCMEFRFYLTLVGLNFSNLMAVLADLV